MLQNDSPEMINAAIEENLYSFGLSEFAKWPRIEVHDDPHLLWSMSDVPSPMFNVVHRARWSMDEAGGEIAAMQERYAARGLPILWWVGPSSTPLELSRYLTASGFEPSGETIGMAIDLEKVSDPQHPDTLKILPTEDAESLVEFAHALALGFESPPEIVEPMIDLTLAMGFGTEGPLINYLGILDGRVVATSSLYLGSSTAGLYNVSTLPEARRQGIGTAVTLASLQEARHRGYRLAVLHSSKMAYPMYRQLGFDTHCYFHTYSWSPPAHQRLELQ